MIKFSGTVRLLLIDDSLTDSERTTSHLRAAGYAVRVTRLDDLLQIKQALSNKTWDLILCSNRPNIASPQGVNILIKQFKVDSPCIILTFDDDDLDSLYKLNVQDIINFDDVKRLQFAVARDLNCLLKRRKAQQTEHILRESEKRAKLLLEMAQNAVAYVHEGMHIDINKAYLTLFGYDKAEDMEGLTLLDLVSRKDHTKFKTLLRKFVNNKSESNIKTKVSCEANNDRQFDAEIVFNHAEFDDEACVQISVVDLNTPKPSSISNDPADDLTLELPEMALSVDMEKSFDKIEFNIETEEVGQDPEIPVKVEKPVKMIEPGAKLEIIDEKAEKYDLRAALDNDDFKLYYQPIVALSGDNNEFYDVHLRRKSKDNNGVSVNFSANYALVAELDKWLFSHAIPQLVKRRKQWPNTKLFIPLSSYSLMKDDLIKWLHNLLQAHGLDMNAIVIKISEKSVCRDKVKMITAITQLAEKGCDASIDYCGDGRELAKNFAQSKAAYLKISNGAARSMLGDTKVQEKVRAILAVVKEKGKKSIAESISGANDYALAWQLGINYIQGSYIQEASTELDFDFNAEEDEEGF